MVGHRTVKRVPLDFDWPIDKVWIGYEPFAATTCVECDGIGHSALAAALAGAFYVDKTGPDGAGRGWHDQLDQADVDQLVANGRLLQFTHRYDQATNQWQPTGQRPTAAQVNTVQRSTLLVHDATNQRLLVEGRCVRLGVDPACPSCMGSGNLAAGQEPASSWQPVEPPTGEGWQLWETVSEGSPQTPVFATSQALAAWCAEHASVFAGEGWSYQLWLRYILEDFVETASLQIAAPGYRGSLGGAPPT
jgi:hypothetical protein